MMNDREFEESLKGIFEESFEENNSSTQIDIDKLLESAYKEAETEINKKEKFVKKKRRMKRLKAAVIFIAIVVASLAVFGPEQGYADLFRFMVNRTGIDGDLVQDNLIGTEVDDTANRMIKVTNLDKEIGFHIVMPEYLIETYETSGECQIVEHENKIVAIVLEYYDSKTRDAIFYRIESTAEKKSNSFFMDIPEDEVEVIKEIDNIEYFYYRDEENMRGKVYWQNNEYLYYMDGNIDKEEAVNIVESLK